MVVAYDEIGYWSEIKLEIIEKYAGAYSQILSHQSWAHHVYIDAFAGAGTHISRTSHSLIPGSPQIALGIEPPFKDYFFIDVDGKKVDELNRLVQNSPRQNSTHILMGDCNKALLEKVFPSINKSNYRALCLLDPYGLNLNWEVIETAGKMRSVEIFLNFPVMDMNRNVLLTDVSKAAPANIARMDALWGDHSWNDLAYHQTKDLFGEVHDIKQNISHVTRGFRDRLMRVAGFQHVPQPIPMRNSRRGLLYYLFFASNNKTGSKILSDILTKYRNRGMN